jgi:dTDP-4-amino-4,6-dideoxygalactose transaminase
MTNVAPVPDPQPGVRLDQQLPIPSEDLTRQYRQIEPEIMEAVQRTLRSGKYTMGPELAAFEHEWAGACEVGFAVGTSSGTAALMLAYKALGVGPGDEVIVPSMTYVATAFAASYLGATVVFADIDADTFNLDPAEVERAVTPRTKVVVPVHLYGQAADMEPLEALSREHGFALVEDAAQAHLARYRGKRVGSFGPIACFSFYPHKNLGAYGDGGALTTPDSAINEELRELRYMGQRVKHAHELVGHQERLDELQAAILRVRLGHLEDWTALRQRWAALYDELLAGTPVATPFVAPDRTHVYYMYTIRAPHRDELRSYLADRGIGSQIMYPTAVPDQGAYTGGAAPSRLVSAERARRAADEILSLPVFPELTEDEVHAVADAVREFYET